MKNALIFLFLLQSIDTVFAEARINMISTNEECLSYVDSLLQSNKNELSYFNSVALKEVADKDFLIPQLHKYITSNSLIGWEKFDLNQDGNMDLYFSISDKYYNPIQGFVIGNEKFSNRIYLFDQFEMNIFERPVFQIQEKTSKKNEILNFRYTTSVPNACVKIICTRLIFISEIGFLEMTENNKLTKSNELDFIIIKYYTEINQSGEIILNFKKKTLETKKGDISVVKKLKKKEIDRIIIISKYSFANIDSSLVPCKQIISHPKTTVYNLYLTNKKEIIIIDENNQYNQSLLLLKKSVERIGNVHW